AGLCCAALGTDTGGSVRIPAAFCGVVGLKTTVGRVSRAGVYPLSPTLDSVGPLTRTVEDAATVFAALQGEDPRDPATRGVGTCDALGSLHAGVKGMRIGIGETLFFDACDPEIESAVRAAAEVLKTLGARVERVEIPEVAEVWSLEKRALYIAAEACDVNQDLLDRHADVLDAYVVKRMLPGRTLLATEYLELGRRFAALRAGFESRLGEWDAVLAPTTPIPPPTVAEVSASVEAYAKKNLLIHRNPGVANYLGLCAISVPCGVTTSGLPIGLMIHGKPFREDVVLRVASAYERATDWHARRPDLSWVRTATSTAAR
ncbi:MAG: amidase, partial [Candidatus Eiseniibacteriota bacterium]